MNKARRKAIEAIIGSLDNDLRDRIAQAVEAINTIKDEEEEAKDGLPESLQDGDQGSRMQEAVDNLEAAASELENFDLDGVITYLNEAQA